MTTKDSNRDNNNNVTVSKRTLILSLVVVVSLSVFLVVSGPLSSSLLSSPVKIKQVVAQQQPSSRAQQPTSQSSSQPSSKPQQPKSQPQQPSSGSTSTTTLSPSTSSGITPSSPSSAATLSPSCQGPFLGADCSNPNAARTQCKQLCTNCANQARQSCYKLYGTNGKALAICLSGLKLGDLISSCDSQCSNICSNCPAGATKPVQCTYNSCVDIADSDVNNCGACQYGNPSGVCQSNVPNSTPVCTNGQCGFQCNPGYKFSNGQCISCPAGSDENCQCPAGEHLATGFNRCDPDCTGVQVNNPQTGACECPAATQSCNGQCVDTLTDVNNCGACGKACPSSASCNSGSCQCTNTNQEIVNINGQDQCVPKCPTGATRDPTTGQCNCPSGQQVCGATDTSAGTCTDLQSDSSNCGACSNVCTGGQTCQSGSCQCPSGQTVCNSQCVDSSAFQSDPSNCGSCGHACASGQTCSNGVCQSQCTDPRVPDACGNGVCCNAACGRPCDLASGGCGFSPETCSSITCNGNTVNQCCPGWALPACSSGGTAYCATKPGC